MSVFKPRGGQRPWAAPDQAPSWGGPGDDPRSEIEVGVSAMVRGLRVFCAWIGREAASISRELRNR